MPLKPNADYRLNKPYLTEILEIIDESPTVKSFVVNYNPIEKPIEIMPGQFVMVWIPGDDEIPMSISHIGWEYRITISVAAVGSTTQNMHKLTVGDKIGIRGPYGNYYNPNSGIAIVIGGGIGMASVLPLLHQLTDIQKNPDQYNIHIEKLICIEGAKTKSQLLFSKELEDLFYADRRLEFCTDDGTCGFKGFVTEKLDELLRNELISLQTNNESSITVYACGPEIMLKKIFDICEEFQISMQVSLERMMRCGFGICGLCALEPSGKLVCRDGPIFTNNDLRDKVDFGLYHRTFSGKVKKIGEL